jgi:hypothetical protein
MPCFKPGIALLGLFLLSTSPLDAFFCDSIEDVQALHEDERGSRQWTSTRILDHDVKPDITAQGAKKRVRRLLSTFSLSFVYSFDSSTIQRITL